MPVLSWTVWYGTPLIRDVEYGHTEYVLYKYE